MARLGFNANDVAPDTGGGPLPEGEYLLQAIEESLEANSKGTGDVLKLTYEVAEGPLQGRQMWVTINTAHSNPVAQEIGQGQLSALCHAMGYMQVEDSEELLWKPFRARTKIEEGEYKGKLTKRAAIAKYHSMMDGDAVPETKAPARGPASRPAGGQASRPSSTPRGPGVPATGRALPWSNGRAASHVENDDIPF